MLSTTQTVHPAGMIAPTGSLRAFDKDVPRLLARDVVRHHRIAAQMHMSLTVSM